MKIEVTTYEPGAQGADCQVEEYEGANVETRVEDNVLTIRVLELGDDDIQIVDWGIHAASSWSKVRLVEGMDPETREAFRAAYARQEAAEERTRVQGYEYGSAAPIFESMNQAPLPTPTSETPDSAPTPEAPVNQPEAPASETPAAEPDAGMPQAAVYTA